MIVAQKETAANILGMISMMELEKPAKVEALAFMIETTAWEFWEVGGYLRDIPEDFLPLYLEGVKVLEDWLSVIEECGYTEV